METFYYDGSIEENRKLHEAIHEGRPVACAKCKAPLIVALTFEAANEQKVHPGIYCSKNLSHVQILVELRKTTKT